MKEIRKISSRSKKNHVERRGKGRLTKIVYSYLKVALISRIRLSAGLDSFSPFMMNIIRVDWASSTQTNLQGAPIKIIYITSISESSIEWSC